MKGETVKCFAFLYLRTIQIIESTFMSCIVASTELWGHNSLVRAKP